MGRTPGSLRGPLVPRGPWAVQGTLDGRACVSSLLGGEHGPLVESRAGFSGRLWAESRLSLCPDGTPASKTSKSSEGLPEGTWHTVPSEP